MVIVDFSAVVLAEVHNASILHPAFLRAEEIVPPEWEVQIPPVTTPAVSTVVYPNGISFVADQSRLNVRDGQPPEDGDRFRVFRLAQHYAETLPHVSYTAVGVNFTVLLEVQDGLGR